MSQENYLKNIGRKQISKSWSGTFDQYFKIAINNPHVAQTSIQRIYNMILSYGTSQDQNNKTTYNFFEGKMFGSERQIEEIMTYLKAASMGLDIKKRVCLLLGPPGSGKSVFLSLLKKGLAKYSRTNAGSLYGIKDCPIHEEPLHLIPEEDREEIHRKFNIKIEGKLCPVCQYRYDNEWKQNINNAEVERIYIDEETRTGIGTFAPSESNEMEELYGSVDLRRVQNYGNAGDVRAFDFNGELHSANRGVMEFIEVLKANPSFLHVLLTLAEEQSFKTPRFPLQFVDELLIAHTNEGEFERFISEKENEAVVDRLYIVRMPYNMNYKHEEQIYHSALKTKLVVKGITVHPDAIRLASKFAIETRKNDNPLRSGMGGISPRFILNTLGIALVNAVDSVVTPKVMINTLSDQIYHYPVLNTDQRQTYLGYLKDLEEELNSATAKDDKQPKGSNDLGHDPFDQVIGND